MTLSRSTIHLQREPQLLGLILCALRLGLLAPRKPKAVRLQPELLPFREAK